MAIGVGIIGCGTISIHHLRGYKASNARLVTVADQDEEAARRRAEEADCPWTTDYQELLSCREIEAVSICVPNWLHYDVATAAIEAGKAVLCEKPMTTRLADSELLVQLVQKRKAFFQVGYMKRYHPAFQGFRGLIEHIGGVETGMLRVYQPFPEELWTAPGYWVTQKAKAGGGPLVHGGSHMIDILCWCCGDVDAVDARVRIRPGTDVDWCTSGILEMEQGAAILLDVGWFEHTNFGRYHDGWDEWLQLRGREGVLTIYSTFWDRPAALVPVVELYIQSERTTRQLSFGPTDYFVVEIGDFVRRVEAGEQPAITVHDGYRVDRIIDALYRSGQRRERILLDSKRPVPLGRGSLCIPK